MADIAVPASTLEVAAVQHALAAEGVDGWLLYDFHGLNPIALDVTGVGRQGGHLATRRWYYLIPSSGEPRKLVHAIESETLAHLPGTTERYAGRTALEGGLKRMLETLRPAGRVPRVAMEYSPGCAIPYVSRVDAGTFELVRQFGVDIVSSADLVQRFAAVWRDAEILTHNAASLKLYRIKDRAFDAVARRLRDGTATTEYDIQQLMMEWFSEEGLATDDAPIVAAQENAGNPHYQPTESRSREIRRNELVLLDLWGKLDRPGSVYADITWVGFTGRDIPEPMTRAFATVAAARDAGIALVQSRARADKEVRGFEVDRAVSTVLRDAGYSDYILHRTGHSLGESVHGTGVNMDDYETHDDRRLLPGTGFTIEPGVYFKEFGIRSEINMVVGLHDASVTGPIQSEFVNLV